LSKIIYEKKLDLLTIFLKHEPTNEGLDVIEDDNVLIFFNPSNKEVSLIQIYDYKKSVKKAKI